MTPESMDAQPARCLRCGRMLRSAASIRASYGAWCRAKIRAAALAEAVRGFTAAQAEKARELVADGGLVPTRRPHVFQAVASAGDRTYLVAAAGQCTCPAAARSGRADRCYHVAAARILTAGRAA